MPLKYNRIMKFSVDDIKKDGSIIQLCDEPKDLNLKLADADFKFVGPLRAKILAERKGRAISLEGELTADMEFHCSKCTASFTEQEILDFEISLVKERPIEDDQALQEAKAGTPNEKELKQEDFSAEGFTDEELDLSGIMFEELMLNLPMVPLCSEDCRGLCLTCGIDLNVDECECHKDAKVDERFAKLKDFKVKK